MVSYRYVQLWTSSPTTQLFAPLLSGVTSQHSLWPLPDLYHRLALVAASAGINLRQVVGLPLLLDEEQIGVIYVFRTRDSASLATTARYSPVLPTRQPSPSQRHLYQQLAEQKGRLDAIIDNSADGVLILDAHLSHPDYEPHTV